MCVTMWCSNKGSIFFISIKQFNLLAGIFLFLISFQVPADDLPGAAEYPEALSRQLADAQNKKAENYVPRTRHLTETGQPKYTNRLILEDSPYLLQHAHNPVNWFTWGDEAFKLAKKENKPIFLSIGYSTCYWCHVMERESFEDIDIARFLNEHFVSIKVDRERHPDIDNLYLTALLLQTGRGGWPMSSFLLPDGRPFFSDTYMFPEEFLALLKKINRSWENNKDEAIAMAQEIFSAVNEVTQNTTKARDVTEKAITQALHDLHIRYDSINGGFDGPSKFANEAALMLLLQTAERQQDNELIAMVENTLRKMASGGIYDQIGGGFHRYSVDNQWQIPHFEKMLYSQANLARVYLYAYRAIGDKFFSRIAKQTLNFVSRDLQSPLGGFYSAFDAESDGMEGAYYVWKPAEIRQALKPEDAEFAFRVYDITDSGNFDGYNVLHLAHSIDEYADKEGISRDKFLARLEYINNILLQKREQRTAPIRDEKIILSWNSMMVSSLALASWILEQPEYLKHATETANYLWKNYQNEDGTFNRINFHGKSSVPAVLEDYASFAEALILLYDITDKRLWLDRAITLTNLMLQKYWDKKNGGFFIGDQSSLFLLPKYETDNTMPSGNSIALHVLIMLSQRTSDHRYKEYANQTVQAFSGFIHQSPSAFSYMLSGLDEHLHGPVGSIKYAANGNVKIKARTSRIQANKATLEISLNIASGWHINSQKPLQADLIATQLTVSDASHTWHIDNIKYPEPVIKKLGFLNEALSLYEGSVVLDAVLSTDFPDPTSEQQRINIQVKLQACDHDTCLPPENIILETTL